MADDPYQLLGVSPDASREDVVEAYRALAQIYHPDRYADAPPRVQAEAHRRMQSLNAAFEAAQRGSRPAARAARADRPTPPPPSQPPPPRRDTSVVHYVDGAGGYHHGEVAPLGYPTAAAHHAATARRCSKLDAELLAWFERQRGNANLVTRQLYASWSEIEQAAYAARVGCSQLLRNDARAFGVPCPECRP
jgi:hypothetical protein